MTDVEIGRFRDLQQAVATGDGRDEAAERLAQEIERALTQTADRRSQDPDAVLAAVADQLTLGELALAAGVALGETGNPAPDVLDRTLADLDRTTPAKIPRQHESIASRDLDEAVATLRERLGSTLDAIAKGTADVVAGPCKSIAGRAPAQWKEAWDKVSKRLFLDNIGGRLLRLGMRAVATALDALLELVDARWLEIARDRLVTLADRAGTAGAGPALLGGVLGAEGAREEADGLLRENGLDKTRLDGGTTALAALADRFDSVIGKLALAQAAVGGILAVQGHLGLAIPWLPLGLLGAELLIGAVALALAIDYVDTTVNVGRVRGARLIVKDATGRTAA
ncbi:hypothetical protein [Asanoa iriomotensis]|uniref:Uncharacterized protein n=1 Tax=Asanoa iriomotensis TaxID=234613 RepID=A0ABQ4BWN9_9ACTN|nr:hypothetical protein [Asanoa iriomotensis]GIF54948.1 hypothetical protein Air01nite_10430 [Asanoa iriomotensis]